VALVTATLAGTIWLTWEAIGSASVANAIDTITRTEPVTGAWSEVRRVSAYAAFTARAVDVNPAKTPEIDAVARIGTTALRAGTVAANCRVEAQRWPALTEDAHGVACARNRGAVCFCAAFAGDTRAIATDLP
jgi:hypothetical protein